MFRACLGLWLIPAALTATTRDGSVDAVIAALAQQPPARVEFVEIRFLHVMDRPLQSSGEMAWLGGTHLQRRVAQPAPELVDIDGDRVTLQRQGHDPRHFSLQRAPELQLMLQSFSALLEGNAATLRQSFELTLQSRAQGNWTLDLVPHDEALRKQMPHLAIDGRGRQLRCMRIDEAQGDHSVELFGPLAAKLPASPQLEALQPLCQAAD
ncbi:LolA-related protein [Frateuria aurantia]